MFLPVNVIVLNNCTHIGMPKTSKDNINRNVWFILNTKVTIDLVVKFKKYHHVQITEQTRPV